MLVTIIIFFPWEFCIYLLLANHYIYSNITMKCGIGRQRLDPVLGPDQFGVARPLGPEDLDRHVTRHGIYPSFPDPTGVA